MLFNVQFASLCDAVLVKQASTLLDCSTTREQLVMQEKTLAIPVHATPALNCLPINQHSIKKSCTVGVSIFEITDNSAVLWKVGVLMSTLWPNANLDSNVLARQVFCSSPFHNTCTFSYKLLLFSPPTHIFHI